jgi:uncharacterized membrane protein HdeD (DUF308 family)
MNQQAANPRLTTPSAVPGPRGVVREMSSMWWLSLVAGIAWLAVALIILQFDHASVTTVGILVGALFTFAGFQNLALASMPVQSRWLWIVFGVLFLISGIVCFVNPEDTFAGLADILGFLFLLVGIWWMVRAFIERAISPYWWVGLVSGVLMTGLAFWTSGQFFITKAYVLLVFAGIWALMTGVNDLVRAFEIRRLHETV